MEMADLLPPRRIRSKREFKDWLASIAAVSLSSVVIANDLFEVTSSFRRPSVLSVALERHPEAFGDAPYWVEYSTQGEIESTEVDYVDFVVAYTMIMKVKGGPITGGYERLTEALSSYEYLRSIDKMKGGLVGYLLIPVPQNPFEIANLKEILIAHAVMFAFPDGTGGMHAGNVRFGGGIGFD